MMIRTLIALMFALGMVASGALAQGTASQADAVQAAQPVEPVEPPVDPDDPDANGEPEEPAVVFPIEDILSTLVRNPELVEFHSALQAAQVDLMFDPDQEYTVFAPTGEAFEAEAFDALRTQEALAFYIVQGTYSFQDLWDMAEAGDGVATLTTLQGLPLTVEIIDDQLFLEGAATVTQPDIPAQNGVVHVIDAVIQPTGEPELGG